jgi:hypothetical protein
MSSGRNVAVSAFRAKRKQPNQNKTIEEYLNSENKINHGHFVKVNQTCLELEQVTLQEHGLSLQQFIDEMAVLVSSNEDITEYTQSRTQCAGCHYVEVV